MIYDNFSNFNLTLQNKINFCKISGNTFNARCINKTICSQFNQYFINVGIIIIISYLIMCWFLWWFLNYGYKYLPDYSNNIKLTEFFGDIKILQTRIYWDILIRGLISKFMIGYIVVAVWLNIY